MHAVPSRRGRIAWHPASPWPCALLLAVMALLAMGDAVAGGPDVVDVATVDAGPLPLAAAARVLADARGRLTLDAVRQAPAGRWESGRDGLLELPGDARAYWVRYRFRNSSDRRHERLVEIAMPLQDYVDFHVVRGDAVIDSAHTGDRRAFDSRPVAHRTFAMPLTLTPGESVSLYIRLGSHEHGLKGLPVRLWAEGAFFARASTEQLAFGLYYGAMVALLLYSVLVYGAMRERAFLLYALYLGSFFVWTFTLGGFAQQYWWPQAPHLNNQVLPAMSVLVYGALTAFAVDYLGMKQRAPRARRALLALSAIIAIGLVPAAFGHYRSTLYVVAPVGILHLLTLAVAALRLARQGDRPALIFLAAWAALTLGVVSHYAQVLGLLRLSMRTEYSLQAGAALQFLLLAFGLVYKINRLKQQKLDAEQAMVQAHRRYAVILEERVEARTEALERLNHRLADLVVTDELTGLHNRRHFNSVFEPAFQHFRRHGGVFVLALMDIDHFKDFNDVFGHQAGDDALAAVGRWLREHTRRAGDQAFRLGGEEFAVLLDVDDCAQAHERIETIRRAIADGSARDEPRLARPLTASFGVACVVTGDPVVSSRAVYLMADHALYRAKAMGRNRTEVERAGTTG